MRLVAEVEGQARRGFVKTQDEFLAALRKAIESSLRSGNSDPAIRYAEPGPTVILVVGVNGAGKTTFIGKLSESAQAKKMSVLVGAGDTFRAGAIDQLRVWAERTGAEFVGGNPGSDPAAVAFDAIDAAIARGMDVVIVDTAGRLHTSGGSDGRAEEGRARDRASGFRARRTRRCSSSTARSARTRCSRRRPSPRRCR